MPHRMYKIVNNAADQAMIHFSVLKSVKCFTFTASIQGLIPTSLVGNKIAFNSY